MNCMFRCMLVVLTLLCYKLHASSVIKVIPTFFIKVPSDLFLEEPPPSFDKKYPLDIYVESYIDDEIYHFKTEADPLVLEWNHVLSIHIGKWDSLTSELNRWKFEFTGPYKAPLDRGYYFNAERYPFQKMENPGMSVCGDGRGCNTLTGEFRVIHIVYDEFNRVSSLALDFIQHCESLSCYKLKGYIRYNSLVPVPEIKKNLSISVHNFEGKTLLRENLEDLYPIGKNNAISITAGEYDFEFAAPSGDFLTVGKFTNVLVLCKNNKASWDCDRSIVIFKVISIEYGEDGAIANLALDFIQYGNHEKDKLGGSIRYNSDIPLTSKNMIYQLEQEGLSM